MGPSKFSIELLNNPDSVPYWPGQEISVLVRVNFNTECTTTGIKLIFLGKARVHFSRGRPRGRIEHYAAEENYLHFETYIFGSGTSEVVLSPGHHDFPYQFTLPVGLPSTHEGTDCRVSYKVAAEVENICWWKLRSQKAKMEFKVRGILDLNVHPTASQAIEIRNESDVCCIWGKGGPILFCMRLPRRGYISGEFISGIVVVHNQSNNRVKGVKVSLIQKRTYLSEGKPKTLEKSICYATTPSVATGETKVWNENILYIPQLPPTSIPDSNGFIDIQYMLKIIVEMPGLISNLKHVIRPIIIGTIPMIHVPPLFAKVVSKEDTSTTSTEATSVSPLTIKMEEATPEVPKKIIAVPPRIEIENIESSKTRSTEKLKIPVIGKVKPTRDTTDVSRSGSSPSFSSIRSGTIYTTSV